VIRDRGALAGTPARETALACVEAGIEAARPERVVRDCIAVEDGVLRIDRGANAASGVAEPDASVAPATYDLAARDRVVLVGGGKAAARVAAALDPLLAESPDGVVVTDEPANAGHAGDCDDPADAHDRAPVEVLAAAHPVPDERGIDGARRVLAAADEADEGTLVLAVLTGGGSALLPAPAADLGLADLRSVTGALLESGAPIAEINAVRKHCSALKGGRLARRAAPATVVGLLLSDVVGDDPATIASGPTAPDPTTYRDALAVLDRHGIEAPAVRAHLEAGAAGDREETPGPDDPVLDRADAHVLASGDVALSAARRTAADRGYEPLILSARVRGEASEAALAHAAVAEEIRATGRPVEPPAVVLSGGETTVTVRGDGRGGPNQAFALAAAVEFASEAGPFAGSDGVALASVDTDGRDGGTDAAGALVDASTVEDRPLARAALDDVRVLVVE
jgi:hydroxypyruvate reductase